MQPVGDFTGELMSFLLSKTSVILVKMYTMKKFVQLNFQSYYSLLGRTCEPEAFLVCKNEGLGVLPWAPLVG